jgi:hypothetical protein
VIHTQQSLCSEVKSVPVPLLGSQQILRENIRKPERIWRVLKFRFAENDLGKVTRRSRCESCKGMDLLMTPIGWEKNGCLFCEHFGTIVPRLHSHIFVVSDHRDVSDLVREPSEESVQIRYLHTVWLDHLKRSQRSDGLITGKTSVKRDSTSSIMTNSLVSSFPPV